MLSIDLTGKRAFVAGVADDAGYGWAIVRDLAAAGATVSVGTWPPVWRIFTRLMERVPTNDKGIRGDWLMLGYEGIFIGALAYEARNA